MNNALENIKTRRSIKSFNDKVVSNEELQQILLAGQNAPSGMNKQAAIIVVFQAGEKLDLLRKINRQIGNWPESYDPFYGAKTVLVVLYDKTIPTGIYDGSLVMGNLMNSANALGIGSCWIHRAKETFETEQGKKLLLEMGIEGQYEGVGNCILGYSDKEYPIASPRKENYVYWCK